MSGHNTRAFDLQGASMAGDRGESSLFGFIGRAAAAPFRAVGAAGSDIGEALGLWQGSRDYPSWMSPVERRRYQMTENLNTALHGIAKTGLTAGEWIGGGMLMKAAPGFMTTFGGVGSFTAGTLTRAGLGTVASGTAGGIAGTAAAAGMWVLPFTVGAAGFYKIKRGMDRFNLAGRALQAAGSRFMGPGVSSSPGGYGFSVEEISDIYRDIKDLRDEHDLKLDQVLRGTATLGKGGHFDTVRNTKEFRKRLRERFDVLKTLMEEMDASVEEAAEFMNEARSVGIYEPKRQLSFARSTGSAAGALGVPARALARASARFGELFRGSGVRMGLGAQMFQHNLLTAEEMITSGNLSDAAIRELGGRAGMGRSLTDIGRRFIDSGMMSFMLANASRDGRLTDEGLADVMGIGSAGELRRRAPLMSTAERFRFLADMPAMKSELDPFRLNLLTVKGIEMYARQLDPSGEILRDRQALIGFLHDSRRGLGLSMHEAELTAENVMNPGRLNRGLVRELRKKQMEAGRDYYSLGSVLGREILDPMAKSAGDFFKAMGGPFEETGEDIAAGTNRLARSWTEWRTGIETVSFNTGRNLDAGGIERRLESMSALPGAVSLGSPMELPGRGALSLKPGRGTAAAMQLDRGVLPPDYLVALSDIPPEKRGAYAAFTQKFKVSPFGVPGPFKFTAAEAKWAVSIEDLNRVQENVRTIQSILNESADPSKLTGYRKFYEAFGGDAHRVRNVLNGMIRTGNVRGGDTFARWYSERAGWANVSGIMDLDREQVNEVFNVMLGVAEDPEAVKELYRDYMDSPTIPKTGLRHSALRIGEEMDDLTIGALQERLKGTGIQLYDKIEFGTPAGQYGLGGYRTAARQTAAGELMGFVFDKSGHVIKDSGVRAVTDMLGNMGRYVNMKKRGGTGDRYAEKQKTLILDGLRDALSFIEQNSNAEKAKDFKNLTLDLLDDPGTFSAVGAKETQKFLMDVNGLIEQRNLSLVFGDVITAAEASGLLSGLEAGERRTARKALRDMPAAIMSGDVDTVLEGLKTKGVGSMFRPGFRSVMEAIEEEDFVKAYDLLTPRSGKKEAAAWFKRISVDRGANEDQIRKLLTQTAAEAYIQKPGRVSYEISKHALSPGAQGLNSMMQNLEILNSSVRKTADMIRDLHSEVSGRDKVISF